MRVPQTAARVFERRPFWYGRSAGLCRFGDARERLQARAAAWPQSPEACRPGCPGDRRGGQVAPAAPGMFRPPRIGRTQCQARRACSSELARAVQVPLGRVGKALGTGVTSVWSSCGHLRGQPLPEPSRAASMSGPDGTPVTLWRCPRARAISRTLGCPNRRQGGTVARCGIWFGLQQPFQFCLGVADRARQSLLVVGGQDAGSQSGRGDHRVERVCRPVVQGGRGDGVVREAPLQPTSRWHLVLVGLRSRPCRVRAPCRTKHPGSLPLLRQVPG